MRIQSLDTFIDQKYWNKYAGGCNTGFSLRRGKESGVNWTSTQTEKKCMSTDKNYFASPDWSGSVDWAWACELKELLCIVISSV